MDIVKQTPNLEFELIYADGTRKRVKEGVLYEAEASGELLFHNGTDRPAVLLAAAECMLVSLLHMVNGLESLVIGMALPEESRSALKRLVEFAGKPFNLDSEEKQSCFRLGQMDMRESVVAMLRDIAFNSLGITRATVEHTADMVSKMEVLK